MAVQMQTRPVGADQWARALNWALDEGLDVLVEPLSGEAFVESATRPGTLYAVSASACSCPAGQRGIPCKHRACYLAQIGELEIDPESTLPVVTLLPARPCMWCHGSGPVPNDYHERYDTCDVCNGASTVPPPKPQRIAA